MRRSWTIGLIAVFAALHVVLYLLPGPWRSWAIYLEPLEGIILGPFAGFFAAFLGSSIARMVKPSVDWMFGVVAEPIGVLVCGLLVTGRWKWVVAIYGVMLSSYFVHPFGRLFPLWTILDILVALVLIYPVSRVSEHVYAADVAKSSRAVVLVSFVGTVADSLTRVFLLVPAGLYQLFGLSFEALYYGVFIPGAVGSYIEDVIVVVVSVLIGVPVLIALRNIPVLEYPLTQ
jgi:hypothetical protein